MGEKKPGKGSVAGGFIGIGFAIFGIIFTAEIYSQSRGFGDGPGIVPLAFGILFVSIALIGAVSSFRGNSGENENTEEKAGNSAKDEELVSRIVGAVKETARSQKKAEDWICAYCRTTVDGESAFCPACGAGRRGN